MVENNDELRVLFGMDEALDFLLTTGFRKPVSMLSLNDRPDLISALLDYHLMARVKTEMDQFIDGLHTFNFLDMVREDPTMWRSFFVRNTSGLTPGMLASKSEVPCCLK